MFKLNMYHDTSSQESPHLLSRHLQLSKSFEAIRWQRHSFPSPHRWMDLWLEHVGICWKSDFAKSNITNILQYLTITNQYPSSTRFMLVNLSVDAQVHGRNHCIWSTSALCAQDLLGILGCFLDVCYNQCLPCNQINQVLQTEADGRSVARTRAPIDAQTSAGRPTPQPSSTTRLPLLSSCDSAKKAKHIQKYSNHISSLQAAFRKAVGKTMKNKTVTRKT